MRRFGITDPLVEDYLYAKLPAREQVLLDMEAHAEREGVPIIGPLEGQFLYTVAVATRSKEMLDVGTANGYSALWLGLAARHNDGRVVTIERDAGRAAFAEAYFRQAGLSGVCAVRRGDALVLMKGMQESFDLIFLDILTQFEKRETALEMLDLSILLLKPGGLLLSDNALRAGRVLDVSSEDASTQGIADFNDAILNHPRLITSIVPLRDGISLSIKTG
jgi:predicted O-methyltransferase YrrM